jgi:hypothetical protein
MQDPPLHTYWQSGGEFIHMFEAQVCGCSPLHCIAPVKQPLQLPFAHPAVHTVSPDQLPLESQVWILLPTHWVDPGVHMPTHVPIEQRKGHGAPFIHIPDGSQVWGVNPLHCPASGAHTPLQLPSLHT